MLSSTYPNAILEPYSVILIKVDPYESYESTQTYFTLLNFKALLRHSDLPVTKSHSTMLTIQHLSLRIIFVHFQMQKHIIKCQIFIISH